MTFQNIITKVESDLQVKHCRARGYVNMFGKMYKGHKDAITDVTASYTDDGEVQLIVTINGKKKRFILGNAQPFASENKN